MTVSTDTENKKHLILLSLILCLGVFLRFNGLTHQSLWYDEANTVRIAEKGFADIITALGRDVSPPFFYFILHLWIMAFGKGEFVVRILPALLGILLIPAVYYVGSSLFSRKVGLISAFITAIAQFHIRYSQEVRMYSLLPLLGLFSTYFLYRALKTDRKSSWAGYILFTILAIYTHNYGFFIAASGVVFAFIYFINEKKKYGKFIIALSFIAFSSLPWLLFLLMKQYESTDIVGWIPYMRPFHVFHTFLAFSGLTLGVFALQNIPIIAFGVTVFLCIFMAGIFSIKRYKNIFIPYIKANMNLILILCYLFVTLAIPMLISIKKPIFVPERYSISAWPAFPLILALGLSKMKDKYILIISLILITMVSSVSLYWYNFLSVKSCDKAIAGFIDSRARENDIIVFAPHWLDTATNYHLHASLKQVGFPERCLQERVTETEPPDRKPEEILPIIKSRMGNEKSKIFLVNRTQHTNAAVKNMKNFYNNDLGKFELEMQAVKTLFDHNLKKLESVTYDTDSDSINVTVYLREPRYHDTR